MSLWDDIFGDDEETEVQTEEADADSGEAAEYESDDDEYGWVDESEKCTCHEPARLIGDEEASPGTVARGHAGATEENTFDEEEPWYGVLATLCANDEFFEQQQEGPGWAVGDSGGGSGSSISFSANVVGALAAAFGTGSAASAAGGGWSAGLSDAGDALAGAVGGAVSGLW